MMPYVSAPVNPCTCWSLQTCGHCLDEVIALRSSEPGPYCPSEAEARYNAEHSPANAVNYAVEGESGPADVEMWTMSAHQWWNETLNPEPTELSGDWR